MKKIVESPLDKRLYMQKLQWFRDEGFEEVEPLEFYRELFPEGTFEEKGVFSGKPNGILVQVKERGEHKIITDDLEGIRESLGQENVIMSPISYFGKRRLTKNASLLHAVAFDLDGQGMKELINVIHQMKTVDPLWDGRTFLPKATYVVLSGHGLHLYYFLEEPLPMKAYIRREVDKIKKGLTLRIWNDYCTKLWDNIQFQPITQGFRIVGSASKMGSKYPVRAFRLGDKWTMQQLNDYIPDVKSMLEYKGNIDVVDVTPINQAKKLWPDWYQKRVVEGKKKDRWYIKRDLYDWWLREITNKTKEGHRYFGIMTLAIYAKKCDISFDELKQDAYNLLERFDSLSTNEENRFTKQDIKAGLQAYKEPAVNYPRDTIAKLSGIEIKENKRNYRTRAEHLKGARALQEIYKPDWRAGNGRPNKEQLIKEWRIHNPEGKKVDCHRDTGIDPKTIRKWWNYVDSDKAEMIQLTKSALMQLRCIESELRRQGLTEIESNQELEKMAIKEYGRKKGLAYVRQFIDGGYGFYGDGMWNDGKIKI